MSVSSSSSFIAGAEETQKSVSKAERYRLGSVALVNNHSCAKKVNIRSSSGQFREKKTKNSSSISRCRREDGAVFLNAA